MGIVKLLKSLFGKPKDTPEVKISISTNINQPTMSGDEIAAYCEKHRKDPAIKAWRNERSKYQPKFQVSKEPICPYCGSSLGNRKEPTRRSKISCKKCGEVIFIDPWHKVFPSVYLNARKGLVAKYLGKLDKDIATAGRTEDFWWAVQQKDWLRGKEILTDDEAGDALWTLMNYNVMHMKDILPPGEEVGYEYHSSALQNLMQQYRDEEKEIKQSGKSRKKGKSQASNAKIELRCPYCEAVLGQVAKPSRNSKRKCKKCGQTIYVNPHQRIFKTPFLTKKRQYLADTLGQLDHWVFTKGNIRDFNRVKKSLGKTGNLSDNDIAEILRVLIVENVDRAQKQADKEHQNYKKALGDYADMEPDNTFPDMVRELLSDFDKEIKNLTDFLDKDKTVNQTKE